MALEILPPRINGRRPRAGLGWTAVSPGQEQYDQAAAQNDQSAVGAALHLQHYAPEVGLSEEAQGLCPHSLRATGATNALEKGADIAGGRPGSGARVFP